MDEIKVQSPTIIKYSVKGVILSMRAYTNIKFVMEAENGEELLSKIPNRNQM